MVACPAVLIIWVFSCLNGYDQSLSQWYWDTVITDYLEPKCPLCPAVSMTSQHLSAAHHTASLYNSLYQEAHLDTSSHLVFFQTYTCKKQTPPHSFTEQREKYYFLQVNSPLDPISQFLLRLYWSYMEGQSASRILLRRWKPHLCLNLSFWGAHPQLQSQISVSSLQDPGFPPHFERRSRHNACSIPEIRRTVSF